MDCFDENCFDKTEKLKCEIYAECFIFCFTLLTQIYAIESTYCPSASFDCGVARFCETAFCTYLAGKY